MIKVQISPEIPLKNWARLFKRLALFIGTCSTYLFHISAHLWVVQYCKILNICYMYTGTVERFGAYKLEQSISVRAATEVIVWTACQWLDNVTMLTYATFD